jgi:hypothetical protein
MPLQTDEKLLFPGLIAGCLQFLTSFGAGMENKSHQLGVVSWEVFNDLYENQYDLIRKIRFFVQAGQAEQNESLAERVLQCIMIHPAGRTREGLWRPDFGSALPGGSIAATGRSPPAGA